MGGGMAGTCLHVSGAGKLSDDIDDTETIDLAVQADGGHAGPSGPATDPAGAYGGAEAGALTPADPRTYIPITEATSAAAQTIDAAGAYRTAGASAPTMAAAGTNVTVTGATSAAAEIVSPPGAYSGAAAGALTPADPRTHIPITEANSTPAETVDAAGAYSAPATEPADTHSGSAGRARPLAAAGTHIPVTRATSSAAGIVNFAGAYVLPDASAEITDRADRVGALAASAALDANGAPPGYYEAGATAYVEDPAGTYSGAGESAPTLAALDASTPVTGATSAAAKIVSPPGTYLPPGATAPIADPGGTYSSGYDASAPTTDPAGTYSSPYALDRLVIIWSQNTPANAVLSFSSVTAVENYYGATSSEATLAKDFFATNYGDTSATMSFTRVDLGQRPHLLGKNISDLTPSELQSINGSIALTFDGYAYSANVNLSGVSSFVEAAQTIETALNSHRQVTAVTTGSSITPESVSFTGYVKGAQLYVTSVSSGSIAVGGIISGHGIKAGSSAQIISQKSGTPGGVGQYSFFANPGNFSTPESITETYGVLTVGTVDSGTVAVGQQVTGAGVLPQTAIDANLSGSGPGSTWVVDNAQTVTGDFDTKATPITVSVDGNNKIITGETEDNVFFDVDPNSYYGFDEDPSALSYMSGTAAAALGLTQASGAIDSSPGGQHPTTAQFMNSILQNETNEFGSFQSNEPRFGEALAAWAQSTSGDGYRFISSTGTTPPAGSSAPTTDPAGTYSPADASAPTPAAPGTYIPVAGATSAAAEITDPAGSYSLAGASAPTLAQPGYYVPTTGASSETKDDPGFYTPRPGATAELPVLPPHILGTVAGQTTGSGQPDTPFSFVTITDKNIRTSDSLSINLTGGGGTLADGAGFSGLTESAAGVYLLSGTAAAITSELDALVFTPNTFSATTTFTLTDTTSRGTSKSNATTTVRVTKGDPVVASVSRFLAHKSKLDGTPGGFDILDGAASITAKLDQLIDPHIDEIVISDNGQVGASVQQLATDQTAIKKLQNANHSPARLAINDTAAHVQAGLSTLVQDTGEIGSITASGGPIVVSAATFLDDQSTLDKIVGGFAISGTADVIEANLDQLDDPNISAITISDNGQISASVAQLTTDATAIGKLENANGSRVRLAINDTAGAVQTGLATLVADTGEIGSITVSNDPIVVSAATFEADQSTLDKIAGGVDGFDVSDSAANVVAALSTLNADSGVDAITADIGDATLSGGGGVNAPNFSESGWATSLTVGEALGYAGSFTQRSGSTTAISSGDRLSLAGTADLSGTTSGAGTLALGGSATIDRGGTISVSNWSISGADADVTLDKNLSYAGSFSESAGDTFVLSGGHLLLSGAATFAGGTVDGSYVLHTAGTTAVSGLTIGGTVEWENTGTVNESGGSATVGDASGDTASLFNTKNAIYDILDNSGIGLGASTASDIKNTGLLEKTGETGTTSTIAPSVTNTGTIDVSSGRLDFGGEISGTGSDVISGAATLEFDAKVASGQTVNFTGSGGELALHAPAAFAGQIGGFDTVGANDTIEVARPWVYSHFTENVGGTQGTLTFTKGASTLGLTLLGDYNPLNFVPHTQANGTR